MIKWKDIEYNYPPENIAVFIYYKRINKQQIQVAKWLQIGNRKIWSSNIFETNILFWAEIDNLPIIEPITNRFEILDLEEEKMTFKEKDVQYIISENNKPISFLWGIKKFGFGTTTFYYKDNELMCDNETLSKKSIKKILCNFIDKAKFTE